MFTTLYNLRLTKKNLLHLLPSFICFLFPYQNYYYFCFFVFISVSLYCDIYIYKILIIYNKDVPKICLKI